MRWLTGCMRACCCGGVGWSGRGHCGRSCFLVAGCVLELSCGCYSEAFGDGDPDIEVAEFAIELSLVEIGYGVPACFVIHGRLGVPLCYLEGIACIAAS